METNIEIEIYKLQAFLMHIMYQFEVFYLHHNNKVGVH